MELRAIRYEVTDRVALITLDRPDRPNAWTGRMDAEHRWAVGQAEADPEAQLWSDQLDSLDASVTRAAALLDEMVGSPEFAEGVAALTERRPPRF